MRCSHITLGFLFSGPSLCHVNFILGRIFGLPNIGNISFSKSQRKEIFFICVVFIISTCTLYLCHLVTLTYASFIKKNEANAKKPRLHATVLLNYSNIGKLNIVIMRNQFTSHGHSCLVCILSMLNEIFVNSAIQNTCNYTSIKFETPL